MKSAWVASLLVVALLSGCAAANDSSSTETQDPGVDVRATDDTGIIRGVVVDSAITPILGATVTLAVDGVERSNETNSVGGFGFGGLQEGTYFVVASKAGYITSQASVEVAAGDNEPPVVRLTMEQDRSFVGPSFTIQKFVGYIECTTSFVVLCGAPNLLTGENFTSDRFTWDIFYPDGAEFLQTELVWETSQTLSPELYFEMETLNDGCDTSGDIFLNSTRGVSPIYATVNKTDIEKHQIGSVCSIYHSIFSGSAVPLPCAPPVPPVRENPLCLGAGVTAQQKFEAYHLSFDGFLPPAGYLFVRDGVPVVPDR